MSNSKRIQKKVAKLERRKYYTFGYFLAKIDTFALQLAIRNFREEIKAMQKTVNNIKIKYGEL